MLSGSYRCLTCSIKFNNDMRQAIASQRDCKLLNLRWKSIIRAFLVPFLLHTVGAIIAFKPCQFSLCYFAKGAFHKKPKIAEEMISMQCNAFGFKFDFDLSCSWYVTDYISE